MKKICLLTTIMVTLLFCGQALAKATNSCDGVAVSFDQQDFATQAQTSLTDAVKNAKSNSSDEQEIIRNAKEIICASVGIEGFTIADIITALRIAGFEPVVITVAARATGLDLGAVDEALAPEPATPAPLPTSVGLSPGKNASPNTP